MNKTHRSLWNCALGAWVAVSEITRARGKRGAGGDAVGTVVAANRTGSISGSDPISQPAWLAAGLPILAALAIVAPASAKTIQGSVEITTSAGGLETSKDFLDISSDPQANDVTKAKMIVKGLGSVINTQGFLGSLPGSTGKATVNGPHASWSNLNELYVGLEGVGILTVSKGARVSNSEGHVGNTQGSTGTVDVIGTNSSWKTRETLFVGGAGTGTLRVSAGATVENVQGQIAGMEGSIGTVAVTGPGSSWLNHEALFVGNAGRGTLMVSQGAKVESYRGEIGSEGNSHGEATVTGNGSSWNNQGKLFIGNAGEGSLIVSQDASVTNTNAQVGAQPGSVGRAEVTGAGSLWNNDGELVVGNEGHGTLIVSGGATVKNTQAEIGVEKGSIGTAEVTGPGSSWISSELLLIGSAGHGTLTVSEGATVKNTQGQIGRAEDSDGTVTVSGAGALWSNSEALFVGVAGKGTLTVLDGATVTNAQAEIGNAAGSIGKAEVSGKASLWINSGALYVGVAGGGTLTISDGARVTNTLAEIGSATDSHSTAEVTGEDSSWSSSEALVIGNAGQGTLTVSKGAQVKNTQAEIGTMTGATGVVTVTGAGSSWSSRETLFVGGAGHGTLTVSDGAKVENVQSQLATMKGSIGTAQVSGSGSLWNNSGMLLVGTEGRGTLTVSEGATVNNTQGEIGYTKHGTGTVNVTGEKSSWNNSGALVVGGEGVAVMTIANQAIVSVGNGAQALQVALEDGSTGTVNIGAPENFPAEAAGTVAASELRFGNGTGRLNFNHTNQDYRFGTPINGPGQLHQIAGTTILTGANEYERGTRVAGGSLRAGAINTFSRNSIHVVAPPATLDLAGFDQTLSRLTHCGTVRLSDGQTTPTDFQGTTLTITGAYIGHGGRLELSTVLSDSSSATDRLLFRGAEAQASGSTTVHVTNVGGLGAQTTGNGIEIIRTENGARLASGTFTLAGEHVDAGAFEYRLVQNGQGASLHSSLPANNATGMIVAVPATMSAVAPAPAPVPASTSAPTFEAVSLAGTQAEEPPLDATSSAPAPAAVDAPEETAAEASPEAATPSAAAEPAATPSAVSVPARPTVTYRAEVPLLSALPAQLRQSDMAMLGDMHQRLGDAPEGAGRGTRKTWGRILRTDLRIHQHGTVSPQSSGHLDGFQAGLDLYADHSVTAGLYVGELKGNMAVSGFASGIQNKAVGHNHLQSRYLGFYGTWQADTGRYADAVLQAADYRSQLKTDNSGASTSGHGWLASLELGQALAINSQWQVEPQAQLIYRQISLDDTALSGANVQHSTPSDWTMRLGVRLKASMAIAAGTLEPYGRINVYKTSGINDVARFNTPSASTAIEAKAGYTSTALAAGATLHTGKRSSVYGELGQHWANGGYTRVKSGMQASLGMKVRW